MIYHTVSAAVKEAIGDGKIFQIIGGDNQLNNDIIDEIYRHDIITVTSRAFKGTAQFHSLAM